MQHWKLSAGQCVGIIGLGGLGHMAVKLAVARRAEVTVFTTSPAKLADAKRPGAREAALGSDTEAMERLAGKLDLLISTVPDTYPMQLFMDVLKLDGALINVGVLNQLEGLSGVALAFGREKLRRFRHRRHRRDPRSGRLLHDAQHQGRRRADPA